MARAEQDGWRWSDQVGWVTAVLIAAVLQLIVAWRSPLVARDGIDFIRYAQNLTHSGRQLLRVQDQHPGYPLMVLGSSALVRPWAATETTLWITAARLPSFVLGLGSVILIWLLARRLFERWTADLAALIFAAMPIFRQNAADGLSDSPHLFFYLLAAWLACEALQRLTWPWWAGVGAASSAAYWIRPEGLAVALVAGATLLAVAVARRGREPRRLLLCGAALATAVLLCALPYPLLSGKLTSKQNPYAQQQPRAPFLVNEALQEIETEQAELTEHDPIATTAPAQEQPVSVAAATPALPAVDAQPRMTVRFLAKTLGRALVEFGDETVRGFRYFFLVFYVLGYLEMRKRTLHPSSFAFLYALATLNILVLLGVFFMSGYISHRHVMPLIALAAPWIALGMVYTAERVRQILPVSIPAPVLAATLALISGAIVAPRATRELHTAFLPALDAAAWIKTHSQPDDRLLSNSKYVAFFTGRPTTLLSDRTPTIEAAFSQAGEERDYDFAVLDFTEEGFQEGWLVELDSTSHMLQQFDADVRGIWLTRVLVLESISQVAGSSTSDGPAGPVVRSANAPDSLH